MSPGETATPERRGGRYPLLVLHPRAREGDYAQSHTSKGADYHTRFRTLPGRALMWDLEKALIGSITAGREGVARYLDFACGTGRVLGQVLERVRPRQALGVDVSPSMLETARREAPGASLLCADFRTQPWSLFGTFGLVTAFRFFANAQQPLREDAMRFLSAVLRDDGILIVNNHRNFWSLPFVSYRLAGARQGTYGMTHGQLRGLAERNSLEIAATYSLGVIPQTERTSALPWRLTRAVETMNSGAAARFHRLGYNLIYVLRRSPG